MTTPRFVTGSLLRHVFVMAGSGAIGLVAIFAVDLINLLYISMLGEKAIAAAVGFSGVVGFFQVSICIGLMIGITALVSRNIGAGRLQEARRLATHSLIWMATITIALSLATVAVLDPLLNALGAEGEVKKWAMRYLWISLPSLPLMGVGMASSALLRSTGDARRSMNVTLGAGVVTAVLDPVFIFFFGLGLEGAAIVSVISRSTMCALGLYGVWRVHKMLAPWERDGMVPDGRLLAGIAGPAVMANLASPVGAAYVTHSVAQFGPSAVAGLATIDRITPVAFGLIFSLSGAIGPILSQNLGAKQYGRVRDGLRASIGFMGATVAIAWLILALSQNLIIQIFSLEGVAAEMLHVFCSWLAASFFFAGALFVANASFNNLGHPLWSTGFNWARATLGTIPLVWWGAQYGPVQVLLGQAAGFAIFGSLALATALSLTRRIGATETAMEPESPESPRSTG